VRLLADTQAALWLLAQDERLSDHADELLTSTANEILLSAVVVWEVAIKRSLGKLDAPDGFARQVLDGGAIPLPVTIDHAQAVCELPWHHRDPFDRLLIAQATLEDAVLVSSDERLRPYGVELAW
jgi:PIN domain nuclease of toxin-antitoxin system